MKTEKLTKPEQVKTYKALLLLESKNRDLSYLMKLCAIRSSPEVPSGLVFFNASEKKFNIVISKNWLESFDEKNLAALIEHEVFHVILNHVNKMQKKTDLVDFQTMNTAQDAIINDLGSFFKDKSKLNKELQGGVFLKDVETLLKKNKIIGQSESLSTENHTALDIYKLLKKLPQKQLDGLISFDEHSQGDESSGPIDSVTKAELDQAASELVDSILKTDKKAGEAVKKIGSGSADFDIYFSEIDKTTRIENFKKSINNFLSTSKDYKRKSSVKRPSRRFVNPIGKIKIKKARVKLCLDLSGSMMTDETMTKITIAVNNAINLGYQVDIIGGDTEKTCEFFNVNKNFKFKDLQGGGGTELSFFFKNKEGKIEIENCTYIVVTDGYFNLNDIPNIKNILFLSTEKTKIGDFKTLFI